MSTLPDDREIPDEVPAPDYLEQHALVDPDNIDSADPDDLAGSTPEPGETTGRVETEQLDPDAEADEADLLEQATSVPAEDGQTDEEV